MKTTDGAVLALALFVRRGAQRGLEPVRLAHAGYAMLVGGCSARALFPGEALASCLLSAQRDDGGWADVEEAAWCLGCIAAFGGRYTAEAERATEWLRRQRSPSGAWGRTARDSPRIPIVGLLSAVAPRVVEADAVRWAAQEWKGDLAGEAPLTYKGGFFLLAQSSARGEDFDGLVARTIDFLATEQQEDGGFAPWKGHPVGSDPWSTGVVLWGLSRFADRVPPTLFADAAAWLKRTQLPDGTWPYHYLDEGTSLALIGASAIMGCLRD